MLLKSRGIQSYPEDNLFPTPYRIRIRKYFMLSNWIPLYWKYI